MKRNILSIMIIGSLFLSGCEYDNFNEPTSFLTGKVLYEGNPVGVRTNGTQLELWQDGYGLKKNIPIYIAQDGTYSVSLFDGEYKMVRKAGAPWEAQLNDTILIKVKNRTEFNVPVTPYFVVHGEAFQKQNNTIITRFTLNKVVTSANIGSVRLYLGSSILTDQNKNEYAQDVDLANIEIGQEVSVTTTIPNDLAGLDYVFARIGVRATVSNEYYYTQVQKIALK